MLARECFEACLRTPFGGLGYALAVDGMTDPVTLAKKAGDLAHIASILADEASALALLNSGDGHEATVARRAAQQAREAATILRGMADHGASFEQIVQAMTWTMSAAAVAVTQAKLNTQLGQITAPTP